MRSLGLVEHHKLKRRLDELRWKELLKRSKVAQLGVYRRSLLARTRVRWGYTGIGAEEGRGPPATIRLQKKGGGGVWIEEESGEVKDEAGGEEAGTDLGRPEEEGKDECDRWSSPRRLEEREQD